MAIILPDGAQLLYYPLRGETNVSAGFKNARYVREHGFTHYGIDCDCGYRKSFDIIASGSGVVLGVEINGNDIGGVVVIRYSRVYIPASGRVCDIVARYMHLGAVTVQKGATVKQGTLLGRAHGGHSMWNHLHFELDTDIAMPFHTPQVVEAASRLLVRANATDPTMFNPIDVLVIGEGQTAVLHPLATLVSPSDAPRYYAADFIFGSDSVAAQRLILPINTMRVTAGYKNKKYESLVFNGVRIGPHYGLDCTGSARVYGSGKGRVLFSGYDNVLGNAVVVLYLNCWNHVRGGSADIVMRYYHLASRLVSAGAGVTSDTSLGIMGSTGMYCTGAHLHIECDTDTKHYLYTPTLGGNSNWFKAGLRGEADTTFNPVEVLHCKTSAPDKQSMSRTMDGYTSDGDVNVPVIQ